ncbi:putative UPF0481 protein At3g02645 [Humulus lupulus]|uniref:putative UPF0481 protein At3g02645 n=1 Tax=Humulus lupulus TaxID=3486 RepID=UPI002B40A599|nr:putative UPF0481 protein At3g02645 [Humulus lupulus]
MTEHVGGDDMRIKVDTLATELEKLMSDTVSMAPQHSPCIFGVPNILSRHKPEAYAPYAFSFGPFHYTKSHLQATQKIKLRYLHELTSRFPDPKRKLMELTTALIEVQNEARECYEGSIDTNMDELVKVLVLDGCFLIELFCKWRYFNLTGKDDPIFGVNCMTTLLYHDLILLENQIPWLVLDCDNQAQISLDPKPIRTKAQNWLDEAAEIAKCTQEQPENAARETVEANEGNRLNNTAREKRARAQPRWMKDFVIAETHCLFHETMAPLVNLPLNILVTSYFKGIISRGVDLHEDDYKCENKHILDLLRNSLVFPSSIAKQERSLNCSTDNWQLMPPATTLQEAGIKFKKATSGTFSSILDIKFNKGVIEIPSLFIGDCTESLFRNLICFEQCLPNCGEVISSYMALLNYLDSTAHDTEIFIKSGIIENWVDIDDATIFFNQIFNDSTIFHFYYLDLVWEVNKYCERSWPRYRRVLMHNYFKHPWALISVVVAAILLILSFLQTLFTIIK